MLTTEEVASEAKAWKRPPASPLIDGFRIVVLDKGFVFVGQCDTATKPGILIITKCRNIRYWGTKRGLGELANGPLPETKLDDWGSIEVPDRAVIFTIPCQREF